MSKHTHAPCTLTNAHVHAQGFALHPLPDLPLAAPRLTKLVLSYVHLHGSFFSPLAACSSLRGLVMHWVSCVDHEVTASLQHLAGLPELDLDLMNVHGLRYHELAAGPLAQVITSLDFGGDWDDARVLVGSLSRARHIRMFGPSRHTRPSQERRPGWDGPDELEELEDALQASWDTLCELQLYSPIYGSETIEMLAELPHLATLQLSGVVVEEAADASAVQQLAAACPWRNLALYEPVSPAALLSLPLGCLQSLQISGLALPDSVRPELAESSAAEFVRDVQVCAASV